MKGLEFSGPFRFAGLQSAFPLTFYIEYATFKQGKIQRVKALNSKNGGEVPIKGTGKVRNSYR
ncbi:MAG: hypothetical protein Q4E86_08025 [Lachnospiraceae bacterium]|nr:hypothetical protein [Lachnospiraceae bacterium]